MANMDNNSTGAASKSLVFTIDVGNSHTVSGLWRNDELLCQWRLKSDRDRTDDELAIRYHVLFSMAGIDKSEITHIVVASCVPTLQNAWVRCCEKHFSENLVMPVMVITDKTMANMIDICTDNPSEVGADRIVNAYAAWKKYRCDLIIIDFGTAITFDCVTKDCQYLGGTIIPGISISMQALSSRAAKLPHVDIGKPPKNVIGKNTVQAMKSGILYGYGALVDGLAEKIKEEMASDNLKIIATGGIAAMISPYTKCIEDVDELLTLKGLNMIIEE